MCAKNLTKKQQEEKRLKEEERRKKAQKKKIKELEHILEYAKVKYSCEFPEDFAERMSERWGCWIPTNAVIDAIIAEWFFWEPYVTPESFQGFVQHELEKVLLIQTVSTFSSASLNEYIGNKATVAKSLPERISTTVHKDGTMSKSKG